jgi:hypothetical protein
LEENLRNRKITPLEPRAKGISNIGLFDPVTKLWYQQIATGVGGRLPSSRIQFCTVGVGDPTAMSDNTSSYEMSVPLNKPTISTNRANVRVRFVYSGYNNTVGLEAELYDEIWG